MPHVSAQSADAPSSMQDGDISSSAPVVAHSSSPSTSTEAARTCNCRQPASCPMDGRCLESSIVYKATVTTSRDTRFYIGATEQSFKKRYATHKESLLKRSAASATSLSKFVWDLKDNSTDYSIKWSILKHSFPYRCGARTCDLCLTEKLCILESDPKICINRNTDLMQKCRHSLKFKLEKVS